jgi:hypothetical protein
MVVVDEVHIAVVDPLVIRHMRIGSVDAHALCDDFGHWPTGADQIVIDVARALLVAIENPLFQFGVKRFRLAVVAECRLRLRGHRKVPSLVRGNNAPKIPERQRCRTISSGNALSAWQARRG